MDTFMGKMPAVDEYGIIDDMAYKVNVVAKTSDYTVKASESGTFFTSTGGTAAVNFTLPTAADGLNYLFYSTDVVSFTVTSGSANIIVADDDIAASSVIFIASGEIIGNAVYVFCDGTKWMAMLMIEETVTATKT